MSMSQQDGLKLLSTLLLGLFFGAMIGAVHGQWQLEQAWEEVNRHPSSFPGGPGSYLCSMGYAPMFSGIAGGMLGGVVGLFGGFGLLKFQKDTLTV